MDRYVNEEYINFIKEELEEIKKAISDIKFCTREIQAIDDKEDLYKSMDISKMGYSTGGSTWTLDNILMSDEARKNILESNIIEAEGKIRSMRRYMTMLNDDNKKVIELRYFVENKKNLSFDKIRAVMYYSKDKVLELHKEAIKDLAYYKYQCIANASQN